MNILTPTNGFGSLMGEGKNAIYAWLDREVGRGDYAIHGAGRVAVSGGMRDQVSFYFRSPEAAARFLAAFPTLELGDGTVSPTYTSSTFPFGRK